MSTLLLDELYDGVVFPQNFKVSKSMNGAHIRPWIYKQGTLADGALTCRVYEGATLLSTKTISFSEINTEIPATYAHGFIRFDFPSLSLKVDEGETEHEYTVQFEMVGYTTDTDNFVGICRRWELKTYPTYGPGVIDNEAPNDSVEPAGLEIFEYKLI